MNEKILNEISISKQDLIEFKEFCNRNGFNYSLNKLLLEYFPYLISPSVERRCSFVENSLIAGKTLDAGAGSGWLDLWLINKNINMDVITGDLSDSSLQKMKILFKFFKVNIDPVKLNLISLPFKEDFF